LKFRFLILIRYRYLGADTIAGLWKRVVDQSHFQLQNNGKFITAYTFIIPIVITYVFNHVLAHYEFSTIGLMLIYLAPALCCFAPEFSFRPAPDKMPNFYVNMGFMALVSIMVGQLICISYPVYLPLFPAGPSPKGVYVIEDLTNRVIIQRDFHAIFVMFVAHSSYYLFGFYLLCYEKSLNSLPFHHPMFAVALSVFYIAIPALSFSPSRDFFYITPGYTTFHFRTRRFWFHLGGWTWVCTVFMFAKNTIHSSFDYPGG
jgi:hypothetical protein